MKRYRLWHQDADGGWTDSKRDLLAAVRVLDPDRGGGVRWDDTSEEVD